MSRKAKTMRLIVSSSLLAAVALIGVSVYQVEKNQMERMKMEELAESSENESAENEVHLGGNSTATTDEEPHHSVVEDEEEELPLTEETATGEVEAQIETAEKGESSEGTEEVKETESSAIVPDVNFTEEMMLEWPVSGTVVMDYSMDHTVYFPTLDVYKYNPAVLLSAEEGNPVEACANCKIVKIEETMETGTTVTTDIGNGYQIVYGQLKDVLVNENDVVTAGTVLGSISEPTRFYTEEGTNLYMAMTKDGEEIDPILYLP